MIKKTTVFFVIVFLLIALELFIYSSRIYRNHQNKSIDAQKIEAFEQEHNYSFCNEKIPLYSQKTLEKFEKELLKNSRWHKEIINSYKRSGKYFPVIEKILKDYKIPDDFKYLTVVESGLDNKTSPRGAVGFWQIMPHTGKEYGLEINEHVDERYDLAKSTRAACRFFKASHKKFKSWTLVAASFNIGIAGLKKRIKNQDADSYYDLSLNKETARYIFRTVAVKDILSNPADYHFKLKPHQKFSPIRTKKVAVDYEILDLTEWANNKEIDIKILKIFNPWLRSNQLPNAGQKKYYIELPVEKIKTVSEEKPKNEEKSVFNQSQTPNDER